MKKAILLGAAILTMVGTNQIILAQESNQTEVTQKLSDEEKKSMEQELKDAEKKTEEARKNKGFTKEDYQKALEKLKKDAPEKYQKIMEKQKSVQGISAVESVSGQVGTEGDILITYDSETAGWNHGHAAIVRYDDTYIVEAWPGDGVRYHVNNWADRFTDARGFWVSGADGADYDGAEGVAKAQLGEPYTIWTTKSNTSEWYCSKLVWYGWNQQGYDLDADGGTYVIPADIENDNQTTRFY